MREEHNILKYVPDTGQLEGFITARAEEKRAGCWLASLFVFKTELPPVTKKG